MPLVMGVESYDALIVENHIISISSNNSSCNFAAGYSMLQLTQCYELMIVDDFERRLNED